MAQKITKQILVTESSNVRTIILNRPTQLNALSLEMVTRLLELFHAYEDDPSVKMIILKGEGRAFCAGGDVAAIVNDCNQGNWQRGAKFFAEEFTLNYLMATYTKPQVSLLKGIVMGGGAGASMHGRFRVATDNTVFAMPDVSLGIFPDVGASYFLSRLPGFFGEYMGLTGARLDGAEMLACGLATHYIPLEKTHYAKRIQVIRNLSAIFINEFSSIPELTEKSQYKRLKTIDKCFSRNTVEEIIQALEHEADKNNDDWISWTIRSLRKASPTSLKVSLRSIREGRHQGVGQCLIREYRMACTTIRGDFSKDIYEGFRAMLQDKDKNPKWAPSKVEFVIDSMVDRYFEAVNDKDWEELKLPIRPNLTSYAMSKL